MADSETIQANPKDLLLAAPKFSDASTAVSSAASSLKTTISTSINAFDGDTHKKLQTLGDNCVKNLQDLANALELISTRLKHSAVAIKTTDDNVAQGFGKSDNNKHIR